MLRYSLGCYLLTAERTILYHCQRVFTYTRVDPFRSLFPLRRGGHSNDPDNSSYWVSGDATLKPVKI